MTTLTGRAPKDTYKDLLQVSNSNSGVDATLRSIEDGEATATLIKVSTTATQIGSGTLVDSNENEVIRTAGVSAAVNEVTITNAATGTNPIIEATGGDTVIGLDLKTKGGGVVRVNSVAVILTGGAVVGETVTVLNALMRWGNTTGTSARSSGWSLDSVNVMTAAGALSMGGNAVNMGGANLNSVGTLNATTINVATLVATSSVSVNGQAVLTQASLDNDLSAAAFRAMAFSG